jgi:hypothetical protein
VDRNGNGRLVMRRSGLDLLCKERALVLFSRVWSVLVKITGKILLMGAFVEVAF